MGGELDFSVSQRRKHRNCNIKHIQMTEIKWTTEILLYLQPELSSQGLSLLLEMNQHQTKLHHMTPCSCTKPLRSRGISVSSCAICFSHNALSPQALVLDQKISVLSIKSSDRAYLLFRGTAPDLDWSVPGPSLMYSRFCCVSNQFM